MNQTKLIIIIYCALQFHNCGHPNFRSRQLKTATTRSVVSAMEASSSSNDRINERLNQMETASTGNGTTHLPRNRPKPPAPPGQGSGQNNNNTAGFVGMTSNNAMSYHQIDNRNSPNSQFVWPPKYVTTSTPVTNSSANSPMRNFHNVVGLPVTSTQYKSPYAVPQLSSGSSASPSAYKESGYKHQLPPTVLMQPSQRSPRYQDNMGASPQLNGNASIRPPPPPPSHLLPMDSNYLQQHQKRVLRSDGFITYAVWR